MTRYLLILALLFSFSSLFSQPISASELLDKAIAYHDPDTRWGSFAGEFTLISTRPGKKDRVSLIIMEQEQSRFRLELEQDGVNRAYEIQGDSCYLTYEGSPEFSEEIAKKFRLTCDQARTTRDYYTYLYGLPMKLKDEGTRIDPDVKFRKFKGKEYLVLKVTYDENVGKDTWYFYFNPNTYMMEVYQFFHDESENDGEYILLEGEYELDGMRLPKARTWFTNKADKLLGTDTLKNL